MTDGIDPGWLWGAGLIAFAFGIAIGVGIGHIFFSSNKRTRELHAELETLQQQFDDYREQVGEHFLRTSELVGKMTDSYRDVYEHLAGGSQALCRDPVSTPRLDIPGTPRLGEKSEPDTGSGTTDEYSDNEADSSGAPDDYLGDSPNVPKLDTEDDTPGVTPRRTLP